MADENNPVLLPRLFQRPRHPVRGAADVVDAGKLRILLQQLARLLVVALRVVVAFPQVHHLHGLELLGVELQEAAFALFVRAVMPGPGDQRHVRRARTDETRDQVARGTARGAVVQAHVRRARAVGDIRNQRHRRHALLRQGVDGLAHHRVLQRHERDPVGPLAMLGQRLRQRIGIEAFHVFDLALRVQRREVLVRVADGIAQHA
ncbi:hypothetical protein D3C86_842630 [compost metagenome]